MTGRREERRAAEFTAFVAAYRPRFYRMAYLLCGDAHRAEDLVQNALVKVYAAWPRLDRGDGLAAYVRRTIATGHVDEIRRPWRRERAGLDGIDISARDPLPVEDRDALWEALRDLAPGQRRVVVLRHYWGLSVEETAQDLNVSTGTVKSQSAAALSRLRTLLAQRELSGDGHG